MLHARLGHGAVLVSTLTLTVNPSPSLLLGLVSEPVVFLEAGLHDLQDFLDHALDVRGRGRNGEK